MIQHYGTIDNKINDRLILRTNVEKRIDDNSFQPKLYFITQMITFMPNGEEVCVGSGIEFNVTLEARQDINAFIDVKDSDELAKIFGDNLTFILQQFNRHGQKK